MTGERAAFGLQTRRGIPSHFVRGRLTRPPRAPKLAAMKWFLSLPLVLLLLTGCATSSSTPLAGRYSFPAAAELHYPVLDLDGHGRFAFLGSPAESAADAANAGRYQISGRQLRLHFAQAECCQFADGDTEELTLMPGPGDNLRVLFRGQTYTLQREPAPQ